MDPAGRDRILLVYDGSSIADRALQRAIELALARESVLTVLTVVAPRLWRAKRGQFQVPPDRHDEEFARAQIARARSACREARVPADGRYRSGAPARVISEEVARGYGALVLGDRANRAGPGGPSLASLVRVPDGCEFVVVS